MRPSITRREKLLDSAEYLFSVRGFHGVSLKQICDHSGVNMGLINYYFGTKDHLLHQVITRRSDDLIGRIRGNLDALEQAAPSSGLTLRALIRAHFLPFIEYAASEQEGPQHFVRLIAQSSTFWENSAVREVAAQMYATTIRFITLALHTLPGADDGRLRVGVYLASAALAFVLQDDDLMQSLTGGKYSHDNVDELFELIERFFLAGIQDLAMSGASGAEPKRKGA